MASAGSGRVGAILALIFAALAAFYQPVRDYLVPRGVLQVVAAVNQFRLPPGIDSAMAPGKGYPWGDIEAGGYVQATAENVGNKAIRSASLFFPRALYWCSRVGETVPQCSARADSLLLGALPGGRKATVEIWTTAPDSAADAKLLRAYADGESVPVVLEGSEYPHNTRRVVGWIVSALMIAIGLFLIVLAWHAKQIERAVEWNKVYALRSERARQMDQASSSGPTGGTVIVMSVPEEPRTPKEQSWWRKFVFPNTDIA